MSPLDTSAVFHSAQWVLANSERQIKATTVDEHLDRAFASLDEVPVRELEAVSEALSNSRHPLHAFAGIFRNVGEAREGGWSANLPRYHVRQAVDRADENFLAQIAGANAPFWAHVRDAVLAYREEAA